MAKVWKELYRVTKVTENTVKIVNIKNRENKCHVNIDRVKPTIVREREIILDNRDFRNKKIQSTITKHEIKKKKKRR